MGDNLFSMDVMVDLETAGVGKDAAILSIGAVKFDPYGEAVDQFSPAFYQNIDLQSCLNAGLKVQGGTFYWWLAQKQEARERLIEDRVSLTEALFSFSNWILKEDPVAGVIWGHGSSFDVAILEHAYTAVNYKHPTYGRERAQPWGFSSVNDTRTIFRHTEWTFNTADDRADGHDALADALSQAQQIQTALRRINLMTGREE